MMFGGEYSGRCSKYFREVLATFDFNCLFLLFYVSSPEEVAVGAQAFSPVPEKRKSCSDFQWYLWSYQGIA